MCWRSSAGPFCSSWAGLEIDFSKTSPSQLRAPLAGFAGSLLLGTAAGTAFHAVGWVRNPFFLAITLAATSLGLIVPVVRDAGQSDTVLGQLTDRERDRQRIWRDHLAFAVLSASKGGSASNAVSFGILGIVVAAVGITLGHAGRSIRLDAFLTRLQDTTAEVRVRISVALLIGFVALAAKVGTADHPRRLPSRGGPQPGRPGYCESPGLPLKTGRAWLRVPHPRVLHFKRRRV